MLMVLTYLVCFEPNLLGHPSNYIRANPMVTPEHIVPEWYFLPFYAILRSVPDKLLGITLMALAIGVLYIIPFIDKPKHVVVRFRYI
jgi:ubiquinol-cytochrome c reductase cytochrome b subunit